MKMIKNNSGGLGHSAVLRTLPLQGSLNRWIYATGYALALRDIAPYGRNVVYPQNVK